MKFHMSSLLVPCAMVRLTSAFSSVASSSSSKIASVASAGRVRRHLAASSSSCRLFASTTATTDETTQAADATDAAAADASVDSSIYAQEAAALANLQSPFLQTLRDRGFLHQCTGITELDQQLCQTTTEDSDELQVQSAYLGFDATADSLHVGSLLQIMILRHLQQSGHRPVVLIGGGTSKVGDPTGKDESRVQLSDDVIQANIDGISAVFEQFLTFGDAASDAIMVNNNDWLGRLNYLDFLRDYGTYFTINRMLSFESVKQRLDREAPFSFLEFNYMILQAYDFLELHRRYGTILQLGGSDQWGNMVSGVELGRRVDRAQLYALTAPLITTSDGKKMGKTANGAVWLRADRLSEYDYWQFWRNTADADVIRFLKLFTELPLAEIAKLEQLEGAEINQAKIVLADQATALLHGEECLPAIHETVQTMFSSKKKKQSSTESLPRVFVSRQDVDEEDEGAAGGVRIIDLLFDLGLTSSKKEARRLIRGGGARIGDDDQRITDENARLTAADFAASNQVRLRAGKKRAGVVELRD